MIARSYTCICRRVLYDKVINKNILEDIVRKVLATNNTVVNLQLPYINSRHTHYQTTDSTTVY